MNWFVLVVAILQFCASIHSMVNTSWMWSLMWAGIAVANIALFLLEGT